MSPEVGTAAACSKVMLLGFGARYASFTATYSANVPPLAHWYPLSVSP